MHFSKPIDLYITKCGLERMQILKINEDVRGHQNAIQTVRNESNSITDA